MELTKGLGPMRSRQVAGWLIFVATAGFIAGRWAALAAALVALAWLIGWLGSIWLGRAAIALMATAPLAWLASNWTELGVVNPGLVTQSPWPSRLVAMSLVVASAALATESMEKSDGG
jgi:hypothetical protein